MGNREDEALREVAVYGPGILLAKKYTTKYSRFRQSGERAEDITTGLNARGGVIKCRNPVEYNTSAGKE